MSIKLLIIILLASTPIEKEMSKITTRNTCFSITSYWPFERESEDAEAEWEYVPYGGQADSDPFHTAYMVKINPDMAGSFVAAPDELGGQKVYLPGWGTLPVWDRFGHPAYRAGPFYHTIYRQWVIGIDIFWPEPLHYLECGGAILP